MTEASGDVGGIPLAVQAYHLSDEWVDVEAERSLVAAVAKNPPLYWEVFGGDIMKRILEWLGD
jgi:hypothetical protein